MVKQQKRPNKHWEIHKTHGKCIENAEESCGPLGYAKDARILMTIAKAGGIGRKWSGFDIKSDFSRRQHHPLIDSNMN